MSEQGFCTVSTMQCPRNYSDCEYIILILFICIFINKTCMSSLKASLKTFFNCQVLCIRTKIKSFKLNTTSAVCERVHAMTQQLVEAPLEAINLKHSFSLWVYQSLTHCCGGILAYFFFTEFIQFIEGWQHQFMHSSLQVQLQQCSREVSDEAP